MALIILAGGKSTRMGGRDKAQLPLGRETMVGALIRRMRPLFHEIFVVAREEVPYADLPVTVIQDQYPGFGPISGIHAGLAASRDRYNFVLACDLPLMRVEIVQFLTERVRGLGESRESLCSPADGFAQAERVSSRFQGPELVIPSFGGFFEPVAAVYAKEVQDVLERMICKGDYRLLNILSVLQVHYVTEEELQKVDPMLESFVNVNTPAQYQEVQEILRKRGEL